MVPRSRFVVLVVGRQHLFMVRGCGHNNVAQTSARRVSVNRLRRAEHAAGPKHLDSIRSPSMPISYS
jgi:hypothetical protein